MKHKKSQGISLNTIIIAAIALIVLVVLVAVFTGQMGKTVTEIDKCKGVCVETTQECPGPYDTIDDTGACNLDPQGDNPEKKWGTGSKFGYCCIKVTE